MANTKISALTADTAPTADDLVVTVNDPGGTPATRKATITNFTKAIPEVIGDSGSGGTKGLVPAPGAGDAAAGKFLKADGTFAVPSGTTPGAHASTHQNGGGDEVDVSGLSGVLADPQVPITENVQDIAGAMATDSSTIDFTYDDGAGTLTAIVKDASIDAAKLAPASVNAQTGTTYTLQASDNNKVITFTNAGAITVTVPSGLGAGFSCLCVQLGAGQVTFSPSSTTVNNRQSHTKIAGQYGAVSLVAYVANTFVLGGDTAA